MSFIVLNPAATALECLISTIGLETLLKMQSNHFYIETEALLVENALWIWYRNLLSKRHSLKNVKNT